MAKAAAGLITAPNNTNNQSITGLGFEPDVVLFAGTQQSTARSMAGRSACNRAIARPGHQMVA
jgi:hypothetical protein